MTRKEPALNVLQISDTHLHAAADSRMRGVTTYATFLAVLEHAQRDRRWPVDAILATGDIVQDESRAGYERFRAALEPLGVPVYSIPGNHDDPKLMGEILASGPFQLGGELRQRFVVRRAAAARSSPARTPAASARRGCKACARRSRRTRPSTCSSRCIITRCRWAAPGSTASRCAMPRRSGASSTRTRGSRRRLRPRPPSRRPDAQRVRFLSTPSTCAQFLPGNEFFALDDRPPGMRWIELYADGRIETEVAWVTGSRARERRDALARAARAALLPARSRPPIRPRGA